MRRHLIAAFKPHMSGTAKLFGTLEAGIVELIWAHEELSARAVRDALHAKSYVLSYGAVRTVLDRLVRKQVLERSLVGQQYYYRATRSRQEFTRSAVGEILDSLLDSFGDPVYARFIEHIATSDPQQLESLAQLIKEAEERRKDLES